MIKSYKKICKKCWWKYIIRFWKKYKKQRYKCKNCWYQFVNKNRIINSSNEQLWKDYAIHKQTYSELSDTYGISIKTVQARLDKYKIENPVIFPKKVVLLIDTTYFWDIWVMAFKDYKDKKILKYILVDHENYSSYLKWIKDLQEEWWIIKAIVCDWKRWLLWGFWDIPTQMCNFHQVQIITRYITKKPRLEANKELRKLTLLLTQTDKESFTYWLEEWYEKYKIFLKEKWINDRWKSYYIHKRTRSAYFSLKRNLKYLFVYYDYIWNIDIPNTTNGLEWYFSHIKTKVRIHRWLKKERKIKLISSLLNQ